MCSWTSCSTLLGLNILIWENRSGGNRYPRKLLGSLSLPRLLPPQEQQRGDEWAVPTAGHWIRGGRDPASFAQAEICASDLPCSHFHPDSGLQLPPWRDLAEPFIKHTQLRPVSAKIYSRSRAAQSLESEAGRGGEAIGEGMSFLCCVGQEGLEEHLPHRVVPCVLADQSLCAC